MREHVGGEGSRIRRGGRRRTGSISGSKRGGRIVNVAEVKEEKEGVETRMIKNTNQYIVVKDKGDIWDHSPDLSILANRLP